MPIVISSKGNNFSAWRTAGEFAQTFREVLLKGTAALTSEQAEILFRDVEQELDRRAGEHDAGLARLRGVIAEAAAMAEPAGLMPLVQDFYSSAYDFFGVNRSAPAFYQLSDEFLRAVSGAVIACARRRLGEVADRLPPMAVIALGPAGRNEFSPFCRLQLLLVHGVPDPSLVEPLGLFGRMLHEDFEASGLQLDQVITPRNPEWRGDIMQWRQRLVAGLEHGTPAELINLLRLADQAALLPGGELGSEFSALCMSLLQKSRTTMAFMVTRVMGLSSGLGMMGGFRLERSGPYRGLFALFDYALLPFTASVTALSLIKGGSAAGTRNRVRDLLSRQELNVEAAENLLQAWYVLNELRLSRERDLFPVRNDKESLYINVEAMPDGESELFRETLETVAALQRNVTITFSGWEEQTAC